MSDDKTKKELSVREERFVQEVASGKSGAEAARAAGYSQTKGVAALAAHRLMNREHVQNRLQEVIATEYPNVTRLAAERLFGIINDSQAAPATHMKAIELLMKIFGWEAPKKSAHLRVDVDEKFKLPED